MSGMGSWRGRSSVFCGYPKFYMQLESKVNLIQNWFGNSNSKVLIWNWFGFRYHIRGHGCMQGKGNGGGAQGP